MIKTCLSSRCSFGVSEAYLDKIANSEWSYVALATACYKLASPARYTVTVGGSTLTIKYLKVRNCYLSYFSPDLLWTVSHAIRWEKMILKRRVIG